MPPKNIDLSDGVLYAITPELDAPVKVGEISEMSFDDILDAFESANDAMVKVGTAAEMVCSTIIDLCTWWNLFYGCKLTNNYLKMHGGVMTRKLPGERGRRCKSVSDDMSNERRLKHVDTN